MKEIKLKLLKGDYDMNLKNIRGTILHNLFLDEQVDKFYRNFQKQYPNFTRENRLKAVWYILRLNYAQYRRKPLNLSLIHI